MGKQAVITFSISVIAISTICVILLMLMIPQQSSNISGSVSNYEQINRSNYTFEKTKDISKDSLVRQYIITPDLLASFNKKNQYNPGNVNPFSTADEVNKSINNSNQNTATNNTTNSNGGISNPSSTNK